MIGAMWTLSTCWISLHGSKCPPIALWPNLCLDWQHYWAQLVERLSMMVQNLCGQLCIPSCWDFTTRLLEPCTQLTKPVDCASTGLYPSELHYHTLWWEGPDWLELDESQWFCQPHALVHPVPQEENTVSLHIWTESKPPVIPFTQYSNFSHLIHVTTWILQFIHNCQAKKCQIPKQLSFLIIQ